MQICSAIIACLIALTLTTCKKDPFTGSYEPFYNQYGGTGDLIGRDLVMEGNGLVVCGYGQGISSDDDFCLIFVDSLTQYRYSRFVGTAGNDQCWSFTKSSDGGYVIAGWTDVNDPGVSNDILVIKTDATGSQMWSKIYGGNYNDIATHIISVTDGYLVSGIKGEAVDENSWILKLDLNGDTLWSVTYGGNQTDGAMSVCDNENGTYSVCGYTNSSGNGSTDGYLMTLNNSGQIVGYHPFGTPEYEEPHCVAKLQEGWIISGHAGTTDIHTHNVFLQFIHPDGTMGKFQTYGGPEHDGAEAMTVIHDRIIIAGRSASSNPLQGSILVETDLAGNLLSQKWLGNNSENPAYGLFADQNQVLLTGYTFNPASGRKEVFVLRK